MKNRLRAIYCLVVLAVLLGGSAWTAETVMVPMRDGVSLATDIYLPEGEGPFPTVVVRTVYGRGGVAGIASGANTLGMALVSQDCRGRGDSEGKDWVFDDDGWGEQQDGVDTINWVREQPWCNGSIGTWGGSALGITQVLLAAAGGDVQAQLVNVAASNFYHQCAYQGGVFRKALCENWTQMQGTSYAVDIWKSHPTYDAFWERYNAEARASHITAPGVHIGGWWDIFQQGTINSFVTRQHDGGDGARGNQILIMGPWPHGMVRETGDLVLPDNYAYDVNDVEQRFLRHWLLGDDTGIMDEPPVRYYTVGDIDDPEAPGNQWRTADDWPPFETREMPLYLGPEGRLVENAPETTESLTYAFDPEDPCPTHGGQNLTIPAGPFDQRRVSGRDDVITFATQPLDEPLEITGNVQVRLFVSTDAPDTDFTAKLVDIYPDGREILMLDNIQRLKFRNGFIEPDPLEPGEVGEVTIDLWSISLIVNRGHRIGLQISSSNYPRFEVNPNTGADFPEEGEPVAIANNTIHFGEAYPSALLLPIPVTDDEKES